MCWAPFSFSQEARFIRPVKYTPNDGLSSYYVTKIIKDSFGFMWIGTQEGLNMFDGHEFQNFTKQSTDKHRLGGSFISDLAEDKKRKCLWVQTAYGDVCAIDLQTREVCHRVPPYHNQPQGIRWNRCLYIQGDTLWMGGLDFIVGYDIARKTYLTTDILKQSKIGRGECNIAKIWFDHQQNMVLLSDGFGMIVLDKNFNLSQTFKTSDLQQEHQNAKLRFWDLDYHNNYLYVATSAGIRTFTADMEQPMRLTTFEVPAVAAHEEVKSLKVISDSCLLFSTAKGFYQYDLKPLKITQYREVDYEDDWFNTTFQLYCDTDSKQVWIGTQDGVATFSFERNPFQTFSQSSTSNTRLKHLYTVLPVGKNTVYCGDQNGLYKVNTNNREISEIDTTSFNLMLFKDNKENVFVSNRNGLYLIEQKGITPAYHKFPVLKSLHADQLNCGIQYNDSLVLFSSIIQKGIYLWNTRSQTIQTFHQDSTNHSIDGLVIVNYMYKTQAGEVLILTEKAIISFNPLSGTSKSYVIRDNSSGKVITNIMDICETDHHYWLASYGSGLIQTDKAFQIKEVLTTENGLGNNCLYRVFSPQEGSIIATTNGGLASIDINPLNVRNYAQSDGLHANEFEQLCGYYQNNELFAGGTNGFTLIDPYALPHNGQSPGLYLRALEVNTRSGLLDTCHITLEKMIIPTDVLQTTLSLSALNYSNPKAVTYAYKIKELHTDWINLGKQNTVTLIGLSHGEYTVQMRACNEDGVWTHKPLEIQLIYLPQWYETVTFKILSLCAVALFIYAMLRYRIDQLKKQQQIRKEIGNDLHDDIGSALNTLKIFTHLAQREPEKQEHLGQIEESITQATMGLRDMIWVLEDEEDTIFELMERIKKFGMPVCTANHIRLITTLQSEKNTRPLEKNEKRNLLLIAKETITNSIKYANCRRISVHLTQTRNELTLQIKDDGIGFNPDRIVYGKGLKSIRYRAQQVFFEVDITTSPGQGTLVSLKKEMHYRWVSGVLSSLRHSKNGKE